ncbi:TetR/AcrR family transcriptional regulator [Microbacterium soli]|uniref:TetR/AcrR family transcriptional regulator n=1 Tax=Microbacterium soli TaxID=446075 RepID=A0ABP7MVT7_9MICO
MGRKAQPQIKQNLLDRCTEYALAHGLPDRVEPLAKASGTSARMLLYHFGTRDDLLREILRQARQGQLDMFTSLLKPRGGEPYTVTLERAWRQMTSPDGQPYLRMFGQLRESTGQRLWPGFKRIATTDWIPPLEEGLASLGRPELATLTLAVIRGLFMDLDATGDKTRADLAFTDFIGMLTCDGPDRSTPS